MSYERDSSFRRAGLSGVSVAILGWAAFQIGLVIGDIEKGDAVHDVQIYNSQLHDQLTRDHSVAQLILDPSDKSFTFATTDPQTSAPETCTGKYNVAHNVASVVGNLTCSQAVPVPAHS